MQLRVAPVGLKKFGNEDMEGECVRGCALNGLMDEANPKDITTMRI